MQPARRSSAGVSNSHERERAGGYHPAGPPRTPPINLPERLNDMATATVTAGRGRGNAKPAAPPAIEMVKLSELRPSPKNDLLYRPAAPDALAVLAEDIGANGLREPLTVTRCGVIVSGHRRHAACKLAGLEFVPVRRVDLDPDADDFAAHLARHNLQRVKGADEIINEQVALTSAEDAYEELVAHRAEKSRVKSPTIHLRERSARAEITAAKRPLLDAILKVLEDNSAYWPLSDRQVHYRLLNDPPLIHAGKPGSRYRNDLKSYKAVCELLTRARIAGEVDYDAIEDPTRAFTAWDVHPGVGPFVARELDGLFRGYCRDRMRTQPLHVELVVEKNTVAGIIEPVAGRYAIPMTVSRGYCSLDPRHKMAGRFLATGKARMLALFVTDLDPEGEDIPHAFGRSMRDDFGLGDRVAVAKLALTAEHVARFGLAPQMKAKAKSSRRNRFVAAHGEGVYELEAIAPADLQSLADEGVRSFLDTELFNRETAAEKEDARHLNAYRTVVRDAIGGAKSILSQSGADGGAQ